MARARRGQHQNLRSDEAELDDSFGSKGEVLVVSGRLRVSERRAIGLVQAAGLGAIQALLTTSAEERDWSLADDIYEAVLAQILTDAPSPIAHDRAATVVAFRAIAPTLDILSNSERQLMIDWLDRAIAEI